MSKLVLISVATAFSVAVAGAAVTTALGGPPVADIAGSLRGGSAAVLADAPARVLPPPPGPTERTQASFGGPGGPRSAADRVLVAPAPGADAMAVRRTVEELDAAVERRLPGTQVREVGLPPGLGVEQAIRRLERSPAVAYAEPDFVLFPSASSVTPNDPGFPRLYGLHNTGQTGGRVDADIDAPEAWATTVGSSATVVAVIDTGTDLSHPDLRGNRWTNAGEVPGNGIDDDANGYVDDVHGWDFANRDNTVFDGAGDEHGTHVSGTLAAAGGNGVGVTGVAWRAQIMPLKFLGPEGGFTSDAIAAIAYAVANGAKISNNSWGGAGDSRSLRDAIAAAGQKGHLFVAAAGNGGSDGIGDDLDSAPQYPAAYPETNIVAVAATDHADRLAGFSNYGSTSVDLGAPGQDVYSTLPNNSYGTYSGTSMASPQVAGAAALLLSHDPKLTAAGLKTTLLAAVDRVPGLSSTVASGGRLNVGNALASEVTPELTTSVAPTTVTFGSAGMLSGRVTIDGSPVAGQAAVVEQRQAGSSTWAQSARLTTTADGTFTLAGITPAAHTDYRARLVDQPEAIAPIHRMSVRASVRNTTALRGLRLGRARVLSGRVVPGHDGSVTVTVLRNGRRVARAVVPLSDARYRYRYQPKRRGTYTSFARWVGDADHFGATGPRRSFTVR